MQKGAIMKKAIVLLTVIILLLPTSCLPDTPYPPPGVWMSEDPNIILFLNPEDRIQGVGAISFFGIYTIDEVETKVFIQLGNGLNFVIYDLTEPRRGGGFRYN